MKINEEMELKVAKLWNDGNAETLMYFGERCADAAKKGIVKGLFIGGVAGIIFDIAYGFGSSIYEAHKYRII